MKIVLIISFALYQLGCTVPVLNDERCNNFIPAQLSSTDELMGRWRISGAVDDSGAPKDWWMESLSTFWFPIYDNQFLQWQYGTLFDSQGEENVFDDWKEAIVTHPAQHALFRNGKFVGNETVLFVNENYILWVECLVVGEGGVKVKYSARMGSRSDVPMEPVKDHFKRILEEDYGFDMAHFYDIPEFNIATEIDKSSSTEETPSDS